MFQTAADAEAAFYRAFEQRDLTLMMAVWADDNEIVCIHPVASRLSGTLAVRDSWLALFDNERRMRFTITDRYVTNVDGLAIHQLHENIRIGTNGQAHPPVAATNVYRHTPSGWRMILHHASPTPGEARRSGTPLH